ncbi:TldD/PmbA family protein [Synechococcus sp. PCC 7336]|uniref:TldD/PmbA family protein n=1 Tax=Synechococcus sp. PCC 7336 TaxID=195250 RepID=UPI000349788E|nr:TldD/PmbA family protein [Synechococcus sp. PCC 7336]
MGSAFSTLNPEQLLDLALQAGASDAEVYASQSRSQPVIFEANRLRQVESVESAGVALRVWSRGRCGLAVACGPVDARQLVDKALAASQFGRLEEPLLPARAPASWTVPPLDIAVEQLVEWGRQGIAQLRDRHPDLICNSEWSLDRDASRTIDSRGLDYSFVDWSLEGYLGAEWIRGDDFLGVEAGQTDAPRPGQPSRTMQLDRWVEAIARQLRWAEETVAIAPGRYPVIFLPSAIDTLVDTAIAALNGRQVYRRASPWCDKLGDRVTSPLLSLSQQPLLGPYGVPFDDEGTPTRALDWIVEGQLRHWFCDRRHVQLLGCDPTGNGFRGGLNHYPAPGLYNAILPAPQLSFADLLAKLDRGIVVERGMGNGGDLSGDFSIAVELGYWVERGSIVGRIKDTMVAGNAYSTLQQAIALGAAPDGIEPCGREWAGAYLAPAFLVEALSAIAPV